MNYSAKNPNFHYQAVQKYKTYKKHHLQKPVQLIVGYGFNKDDFTIEVNQKKGKNEIVIVGKRPEGSSQIDMGFKAEIGFKCKRPLMACDLELTYEGDTVWIDIRGEDPPLVYKYTALVL